MNEICPATNGGFNQHTEASNPQTKVSNQRTEHLEQQRFCLQLFALRAIGAYIQTFNITV